MARLTFEQLEERLEKALRIEHRLQTKQAELIRSVPPGAFEFVPSSGAAHSEERFKYCGLAVQDLLESIKVLSKQVANAAIAAAAKQVVVVDTAKEEAERAALKKKQMETSVRTMRVLIEPLIQGFAVGPFKYRVIAGGARFSNISVTDDMLIVTAKLEEIRHVAGKRGYAVTFGKEPGHDSSPTRFLEIVRQDHLERQRANLEIDKLVHADGLRRQSASQ